MEGNWGLVHLVFKSHSTEVVAESAIPGRNLGNPVESIGGFETFSLGSAAPRDSSVQMLQQTTPVSRDKTSHAPSLIRSAPNFSLDDRKSNLAALINAQTPKIGLRLG
jgi:hypothetical protein